MLCFRSPVYCWRRCKRLCHPHSWNVMHAVHRVCFKREAAGGGEEVVGRRGEPSLVETGCTGAPCLRWGLLLLLLLLLYYFMKQMKPKAHFPSTKNFSINLFLNFFKFFFRGGGGKLSMTIHHGCLVFSL